MSDAKDYDIRVYKPGHQDITVKFNGSRKALELKIEELRKQYPGWSIHTGPDMRPGMNPA